MLTSEINYDNQRFELLFSTPPLPSDAEKLNRYPFRYKGERIPFDSLHLNYSKVLLFPYMSEGSLNEKIFSNAELVNQVDFDIRIRRMKDVFGNTFNKSEKITVNQFREFFVQEIKANDSLPEDTRFMDKTRPIYSNQPIFKSDDIDDYWMNTPLK